MHVKNQMPPINSFLSHKSLSDFQDLKHYGLAESVEPFARGKRKHLAIRLAAKMQKGLDAGWKCATINSFISHPYLLVLSGMDGSSKKGLNSP